MPSITYITDKPTNDAIVAHTEKTDTPTVIYISMSAIPECVKFTPQYESMPDKYPDVTFCQMEMDAKTSPMIKFAPHQAPILIIYRANWCKTFLGGDVKRLEEGIKEMLGR